MTDRPPVSGEPRRLLANAPERVQRCTTHHACDCHQWMVARWWEASTGAALDALTDDELYAAIEENNRRRDAIFDELRARLAEQEGEGS